MCKWLENKLHIYSLGVTVTTSQDYFLYRIKPYKQPEHLTQQLIQSKIIILL